MHTESVYSNRWSFAIHPFAPLKTIALIGPLWGVSKWGRYGSRFDLVCGSFFGLGSAWIHVSAWIGARDGLCRTNGLLIVAGEHGLDHSACQCRVHSAWELQPGSQLKSDRRQVLFRSRWKEPARIWQPSRRTCVKATKTFKFPLELQSRILLITGRKLPHQGRSRPLTQHHIHPQLRTRQAHKELAAVGIGQGVEVHFVEHDHGCALAFEAA